MIPRVECALEVIMSKLALLTTPQETLTVKDNYNQYSTNSTHHAARK